MPAKQNDQLKKIWRSAMLGLHSTPGRCGALGAEILQTGPLLSIEKLILAPDGYAPALLRLNGEDCEGGHPTDTPGTYNIETSLPLLRAGDRIELHVEWRGKGEPGGRLSAALVGGYWDESSYVMSHEIDFDSGRDVALGESMEILAMVDRPLRPDRFWAPRAIAQAFLVEQIIFGNHDQIVRGYTFAASALMAAGRDFKLGTLNAGLPAKIWVRCVSDKPQRFRGKFIGEALR